MDGTELDPDRLLVKYQQANKKPNKQIIVNFRFDMKNVIVLRLFGTDKYIYIKYNASKIRNLDQLRERISWNHLENIDKSFKNT